MKIDSSDGALLLSGDELRAMAATLGLEGSLLALLPAGSAPTDPGAGERLVAELTSWDPLERAIYSNALAAVCAPEQVARVHWQADGTVSRTVLAWPPSEAAGEVMAYDALAALAERDEGYALSLRTVDGLCEALADVLLVDESLRGESWSSGLSAMATLALLAVGEAFRRADLESLLAHRAPRQTFVAGDVLAALEAAAVADARWPLHLAGELLPGGLLRSLEPPAIDEALAELGGLGLLEQGGEGEPAAAPGEWRLSEGGLVIARSLAAPLSTATIRLTALRADGSPGHELLVFVRGARHLWLFDVTGGDGAIASLAPDEFLALVVDLAAAPPRGEPPPVEAPPVEASPPAGDVVQASARCDCGHELPASARFCSACGRPVAQASCPGCGEARRPGAAFCQGCGRRW